MIHLSELSRGGGGGEDGADRGGDFDCWLGIFVKTPTPGQHVLSKFTKKSDFNI